MCIFLVRSFRIDWMGRRRKLRFFCFWIQITPASTPNIIENDDDSDDNDDNNYDDDYDDDDMMMLILILRRC